MGRGHAVYLHGDDLRISECSRPPGELHLKQDIVNSRGSHSISRGGRTPGARFSYRQVRFSLVKIVLYVISVYQSCDFCKYLRKSRYIYDNIIYLRGRREFENGVFGRSLHGNVG